MMAPVNATAGTPGREPEHQAPVRTPRRCDLRAPLLEARNLRRSWTRGGERVVALEDFSLVIGGEKASFTAVAGESGSGKTTLARLLLGLLAPTRERGRARPEVLYRGRSIRGMTRGERRDFRRKVQAVFQDPLEVYNPFYRVDHLLATPVAKFKLAGSKSEARDLVAGALEAVGLRPAETLGRYPHELSAGQLQRLTVARALLLRPRLVIADEPVSMVDASLRATILAGLQKLHREFGISFLFITHDLATAYQVSDDIVILYQGTVVETGPVEAVVVDPKHPYTQELVASIPKPDPGRRWREPVTPFRQSRGSDGGTSLQRGGSGALRGCKYLPRCPRARPGCGEVPPPLYRAGDARAVACCLHEGSSPRATRT